MTATIDNRPPRMRIVHRVLDAAKDNQDDMVIGACRRLMRANAIGWRTHADPADWQLVKFFYGELSQR